MELRGNLFAWIWGPSCGGRFPTATHSSCPVLTTRNGVCLDGLRNTPQDDDFFASVISSIRGEDRYVACASLATVRKTNEEDDFVAKIEYFTLHSWTKEEYVESIADPAFYDTVAAKFDATNVCDVNEKDDDSDGELSEDDKKYRALGMKFYYAGGSCRFMFQYATQVVIQSLAATVDRTVKDKLFAYCSFAYDDSPINNLYGSHSAKHKRYGERFPVSSFAASLLAEETSEDVIELLAIRVNTRASPVVAGRLFEWLFFASISTHQVRLFGHDAGVEDKLPHARVVGFDPTKHFRRFDTMGLSSSTISDRIGFREGEKVKAEQKLRIAGDQLWLRPVVWDQGCYDAVYFDTEEGEAIFVQVAYLGKQDVKMCYINEVMAKLKLAGMEISTVEIFLVATPDRYGELLGREVRELNDVDGILPKEFHVKVRAFEAAPVRTYHW